MKKQTPWLMGGISIALGLGLVCVLMGVLLPGGWIPPEVPPPSVSSPAQGLRKRMDSLAEGLKGVTSLFGKSTSSNASHRVFVSRPLIYLPKDPEPVQPIRDQQITDDGIQVGWKLKNQFDPEDPSVADTDTDRDGFTNKEEYEKGTNPRDPASSPAKWVKIKIAAVETNTLGIGLSGKSSDRYTLRFQYAGKKKDVDVGVGDQLWLASSVKGLELFKVESEWNKVKDAGNCPHAIPILVKAYHEDKGERLDEKTKTKNDYDDSYLELERTDGVSGAYKIMIDERGKSRGVVWGVGDIRLISLVPGEGELGPYRVGQTFPYAGKEFVIREASPVKISLWMKPEGEEVQILPKTP